MVRRFIVKLAALAMGVVLAAASPAQAQDNSDLLQRLERLDNQVRSLTAMVEELTFRISDLEQLVEILRADNEALYQILAAAGIDPFAAAGSAPAASPAASPAPVVAETPVEQPAAIEPPAAAVNPSPAVETPAAAGGPLDLAGVLRPDGNLNIDGGGAAPVEETPEPAQSAALPPAAISGNAAADYDIGYQLVLNGDYAEAEAVFRDFLAAYPGNALAVDARFWLAESMLSRGMYREAAAEFYDAYVTNPTHEKAPDMLLKLGISLAALGQRESACGTFEQVVQRYPNAPNALLQRVAIEQTNAGC